MAAGPSNGNRSILDMLKNFKPPEKPKLNYDISSSSPSPGMFQTFGYPRILYYKLYINLSALLEGSPVLKKKGAVINLNSDSDSDSNIKETVSLDSDENVC